MTIEGILATVALAAAVLYALRRMPGVSGDGGESRERPQAPTSGHDYLHAEPGSYEHDTYWELRQRERERREAEDRAGG